jgi:uncharacterized protein (DUF4415 family)
MSEKDSLNKSQTDWARLEAMRDDEIDFSDIPALTEEQLQAMRPTAELIPALRKQPKQQVTIPLDTAVVDFFKQKASTDDVPYQALINAVLRDFVVRGSNKNELRLMVREIVREELSKAV